MQKKCPNCGHAVSNTRITCPNCGKRLQDEDTSDMDATIGGTLIDIAMTEALDSALDSLTDTSIPDVSPSSDFDGFGGGGGFDGGGGGSDW